MAWGATATLAAALAAGAAAAPAPSFTPIGTYATGLGETSGETVAYFKNRMYVTNTLGTPWTSSMSVTLRHRAVSAGSTFQSGGRVPLDSVDPEGSVSIIEIEDHDEHGWKPKVRTVSFAAFNVGGTRGNELPAGVRLNGPGASVAQDLEPEYVAFAKDGRTGYVTLQENNTVAVVDLKRARVIKFAPLGTKDHNVTGFGLDASDRDGVINIQPWPVRGMFMPDAIARFSVRGDSYLITANEGDGRDYTGFTDESPVSALTLAIPGADILQLPANLGRLTVSNTDGLDAAGKYGALYAFGARSATIWNASTGARVWDSGDMFEQVTAAAAPLAFNASNTTNVFDNRSDNKGPEPEGVTATTRSARLARIAGRRSFGSSPLTTVPRDDRR